MFVQRVLKISQLNQEENDFFPHFNSFFIGLKKKLKNDVPSVKYSNERVLHISQSSRTGTSPSDGLMSYP